MELGRAHFSEHFGIKFPKYAILVVSRLWFSAPQLAAGKIPAEIRLIVRNC